jgi:hypothetical protein
MMEESGFGSAQIMTDPDAASLLKIRTPNKPANTKSCDTVAMQHPLTPIAPSPSPRRNGKRQTQAAATPAVHLSSPE